MKIVFCGPPHSGKSVFIANLIDKLPTDEYTVIRACPDGEGTWSNNKNQKETGIVRKKGKFTKTFIDYACQAIDNQTNKIVLVDVGGAMSQEKEQIFGHCDSFIVISNNEKKKQEWLVFGQNLGLECVGCLDSNLEGKEEIYSRTPYLRGKIVGLERGKIIEESTVITAIASDIIQRSRYSEKSEVPNNNFEGIIIDDTELGFKLGYGKEKKCIIRELKKYLPKEKIEEFEGMVEKANIYPNPKHFWLTDKNLKRIPINRSENRNTIKSKIQADGRCFRTKIKTDMTGESKEGKKIIVDNLSKWLFGVPGARGNLTITKAGDCIQLPGSTPDVAIELIENVLQERSVDEKNK